MRDGIQEDFNMCDYSKKTIEVIWCAWDELRKIRARDGAPEGVCPEYFSSLTDDLKDMLPKEYQNPWHPRDARHPRFVRVELPKKVNKNDL